MDNQRLLVWAFFLLLAWMTWQTWQRDYRLPPAPVTESADEQLAAAPDMPVAQDEDLPTITADDDAPAQAPGGEAGAVADAAVGLITVSTDVFDLTISTAGGTLQRAVLKKYPIEKDHPELVRLLDVSGKTFGLIESGVRAASGAPEATHLTIFSASQDHYELDAAEELVVPLTWTDPSGVSVEKRYTFRRGS